MWLQSSEQQQQGPGASGVLLRASECLCWRSSQQLSLSAHISESPTLAWLGPSERSVLSLCCPGQVQIQAEPQTGRFVRPAKPAAAGTRAERQQAAEQRTTHTHTHVARVFTLMCAGVYVPVHGPSGALQEEV